MRNRSSFKLWLWASLVFAFVGGGAFAVGNYKNAISFGPGVGSWNSATGSSSGHGIYWNNATNSAVMHKEGGPDVPWGSGGGGSGGGGGGPTSTHVLQGTPIPTGTVTPSAVVYKRDISVPTDVSQVRIHIANLVGDGTTTAVDATINVSVCTSNGSLGCTGPQVTHLSQTLPGDGTDLVLPSTSTWDSVTPGGDGKILVIYSVPAQDVAFTNLNSWGCYASATSTVDPAPACTATDVNPVFWIHVEYVTAARRVVIKGDSLSIGSSGATPPGYSDAWTAVLGRTLNYSVSTEGMNGASMGQNTDFTTYPDFWHWAQYIGADCFIALGTNDYSSGFMWLKDKFFRLVGELRARGCAHIYSYTLPPCVSYIGFEATRLTWNRFLRAAGNAPTGSAIGEITHIFDFDDALDPTHSGALSTTACNGGTSCDSGDGCHWSTTAGPTLVNRLVAEGF